MRKRKLKFHCFQKDFSWRFRDLIEKLIFSYFPKGNRSGGGPQFCSSQEVAVSDSIAKCSPARAGLGVACSGRGHVCPQLPTRSWELAAP